MSALLSLTEAAAVSELPSEVIRTALEKNSIPLSHKRKAGKAVRHRFSIHDVLLLKLLAEFPFPLSREDKEALHKLVTGKAQSCEPWRRKGRDLVFSSNGMRIVVEFKALRTRLLRNLATFDWGKKRVVSLPGILSETPVFRGTRIPVSHVAELFRKGVSEQEIAEDFPRLSRRDLAYAKLCSRMGARPGRPPRRLQIRKKHKAA